LSKLIGSALPADLFQRLSGKNLEAHAETAILICTVDAQGWPHPAVLSYFEVLARDDRNVRLAIYGNSSSAANVRRNGKLTILVYDDRVAYYIKGAVEELAREMHCSPENSKLNLRVEQVLQDEANEEFESGAYITSGVTYKRRERPHFTEELLKELAE
jgi:hypothetical protein